MKFIVLNMFFFGFSVFLIGILILLKRWDEVARRWFYFSLAVTGYAIGYGLVFSNDTPDKFALVIARIANASAACIPATWLYFVCGFLNLNRQKLFRILWPVTIFLAVTGITQLGISSLSFVNGTIRHPEAGPTLHLQMINYFCLISYGFYLMFRSLCLEPLRERKREILSLILATIFGFIGGSGEFSIIYLRDSGIDLSFMFITFPFIMAYVMIKQRVLDIEKVADIFQREKLATIGLIASSINHEIRNPLYAAKGLLENFKEGLGKKSVDEVTDKTLFQIVRALDVITKLNRFAKPSEETGDAGQGAQANIQEAIQNVLDLVSHEFELDRIHIENHVSSNLPSIQIDQRHLEEVLFNLIVNACYAMKGQGGTLTLNSKFETHKLILEISDTGTGIPSEQAKHLFEPFHTTKGEKGTGLGLYITKQLVERNGGKITVKTTEGHGTTFVLEFKVLKKLE